MSDLTLNFLGINTTNFDEMLRFYTEVMKLEVKHSKPGWAAFQTIDVKLELFSTNKITNPLTTKDPSQTPNFIGFESKDIQHSLNWMKSKNVPIVENIATHSWGIDFYITDPDGNLLQIAQYT